MPPKSAKRQATAKANESKTKSTKSTKQVKKNDQSKEDVNAVSVPDRETWPGWVEMESEPAFFNVMLKDMGVHGVKVQEVWSLDDEMLVMLPKPVHALIFLFSYRETDERELGTDCPANVWYAEQIPEFACASVALLNIINNIPGLEMGKDLCDFKKSTQDMTPHKRGHAIDDFAFARRIHNSFATDEELLQADEHMKEKAARAAKKQATAEKARKTKATKAAKAEKAAKAKAARANKAHGKSSSTTPPSTNPRSGEEQSGSSGPKGDSPKRKRDEDESATSTPSKKSKTDNATKSPEGQSTESTSNPKGSEEASTNPTEPSESPEDQLNNPPKPLKGGGPKKLKLKAPKPKSSSDDYDGSTEEEPQPKKRRSTREPKPTKKAAPAEEDEEDEYGFHFCAYMPVGDRVYKLDGMDRFPQDLGTVEEGKDWLSVAQPVLQGRMAQYAAGAIQFNIMAVVHDPMVVCVEALAANVKLLEAVGEKLAGVAEGWKEMVVENKDVVLGACGKLGLENVDIAKAEIGEKEAVALAEAEDLVQLLALREQTILDQTSLRAACRDERESAIGDMEKAQLRRLGI